MAVQHANIALPVILLVLHSVANTKQTVTHFCLAEGRRLSYPDKIAEGGLQWDWVSAEPATLTSSFRYDCKKSSKIPTLLLCMSVEQKIMMTATIVHYCSYRRKSKDRPKPRHSSYTG